MLLYFFEDRPKWNILKRWQEKPGLSRWRAVVGKLELPTSQEGESFGGTAQRARCLLGLSYREQALCGPVCTMWFICVSPLGADGETESQRANYPGMGKQAT